MGIVEGAGRDMDAIKGSLEEAGMAHFAVGGLMNVSANAEWEPGVGESLVAKLPQSSVERVLEVFGDDEHKESEETGRGEGHLLPVRALLRLTEGKGTGSEGEGGGDGELQYEGRDKKVGGGKVNNERGLYTPASNEEQSRLEKIGNLSVFGFVGVLNSVACA